jgi:hypothetical protein
MIATYAQIQGNFVDDTFRDYTFLTNSMYCRIRVTSTFVYPLIARKFGLKFILMSVILCDMLNLETLRISIISGASLPL